MSATLTAQEYQRLIVACVLREKRDGHDRRQRIAYPRGGRRAADARRVQEYRQRCAAADPFRWSRRLEAWVWTVGLSAAIMGMVVVGAWWR